MDVSIILENVCPDNSDPEVWKLFCLLTKRVEMLPREYRGQEYGKVAVALAGLSAAYNPPGEMPGFLAAVLSSVNDGMAANDRPFGGEPIVGRA